MLGSVSVETVVSDEAVAAGQPADTASLEEQAMPSAHTGDETAAEAAPATEEAVEMEVWRPSRRRHGGGKHAERKPRREKRNEDGGSRNRKDEKQPRRNTRPEQRSDAKRKPQERKPDPDSPFAALAVLKERGRGN